MSKYASLVGDDFCPKKRGWTWFTYGNFSKSKAARTTQETIVRVGDLVLIDTGTLMVITSVDMFPPGEDVGIYIVYLQSKVAVTTNINAVIHLRGTRIAR